MVKIKATNQALLAPLQHVTGIVERRHTLPILSNVLIQAHGGVVDFVATDLEVQITAKAVLEAMARKARSPSVRASSTTSCARFPKTPSRPRRKENRMVVRAARAVSTSRRSPRGFPRMVESKDSARTSRCRKRPSACAGLVTVRVAVQDIAIPERVLFSVEKNMLRVVATDGHRLSFAAEALDCRARKRRGDPSAQ